VAARRATVVLVVLLVATSCGGDGEMPPGQQPNTVVLEGQVANDHGSVSIEREGEPTLVMGDFYFEPTVLIGPPGGPRDVAAVEGTQVFVTVRSAGRTQHSLTIPDQELDLEVAPGEEMRVVVTFPDSGTVVFTCKYHRDRGMAGALVAT
jgi:hypothetical protein